jgi:hypothetical protein
MNRAQRRKFDKVVRKQMKGKEMGFMDMISDAAERKRAAEANNEGAKGDKSLTTFSALGLQLPDKQTISTGCITWTWNCLEDAITITAMLLTTDDPEHELVDGQFIVQMAFNNVENTCVFYTFSAEETFELGQTLLSARNWEFEWKKYAADFLLKWMSEQDSKTDSGEVFIEPTPENMTIQPGELGIEIE